MPLADRPAAMSVLLPTLLSLARGRVPAVYAWEMLMNATEGRRRASCVRRANGIGRQNPRLIVIEG
jgi:hypothetical protein